MIYNINRIGFITEYVYGNYKKQQFVLPLILNSIGSD
jgi:hypothetical protein